jgi:hypothetical protein
MRLFFQSMCFLTARSFQRSFILAGFTLGVSMHGRH